MSSILNTSFVKAVTKRVDDCSNPIQLREYLNKYRDYIFTPAIQDVFLDRLEFFKIQYLGDTLFTAQCVDLEEMLTTEIQIAAVCGGKNLVMLDDRDAHKKLIRSQRANINTDLLMDEDDEDSAPELELLRQVFLMTNGNKVDICRILGVDNAFLNKKIFQYKLKEFLNEIRRNYRKLGRR